MLVEYRRNKTTELFRKLDKVIFFFSGINYWIEDNGLPDLVQKAYKKFSKLVTVAIIFLLVAEYGAFFTQNTLTEKQKSDRILMTFSHPIIFFITLSLPYNRGTVTEVMFALAVELKKDFNDEETEKRMLKKTRVYVGAFVVLCYNTLVFYGVDAIFQVFFSDGTFVTVIPAWPEVHDNRAIAEAARIGFYVMWWLWMCRGIAPYLILLPITISLSHQYTNLQLYFKSIAGIFEERISQSEKEEKFERAFKVGIRLHATTIWCAQQVQKIGSWVFSGQIIINIALLVLLMSQFQSSERTMSNTLPTVATILCMLFSTGVIMCSAGDITVEAANLPTAIFQSGWQNCTNHSSFRIKRMVLIAIAQSQKPVVITSCGFISLSYQSYLSIVKTSYSIFSVLY